MRSQRGLQQAAAAAGVTHGGDSPCVNEDDRRLDVRGQHRVYGARQRAS